MRIFEMRFSGNNGGAIETFDSRFIKLLGDFLHQLGRNGLILDGGVQSYIDNGQYVCRVIAQDDDAFSTSGLNDEQMNYDTRKAMTMLRGKCAAPVQIIRREACVDIPHCKCRTHSHFILQYVPEWMGSPLVCGDCRCSVPLYRIMPDRGDREFDDLLRWRKLYRGYVEQFRAGINARYAYDMVRNCRSEFAAHGRRISGYIEKKTGVITFYPIYSHLERKPDRCPQCGGPFVNVYTDAINYERCCRNCRLVM